jgi:hypothetical protein
MVAACTLLVLSLIIGCVSLRSQGVFFGRPRQSSDPVFITLRFTERSMVKEINANGIPSTACVKSFDIYLFVALPCK